MQVAALAGKEESGGGGGGEKQVFAELAMR